MESFYSSVCLEIDALYAEQGVMYGSVEGLNSNIIGRLFVGVVDTFGQLLNTFGSNLVNITKSIKRSELNEFVSSNMLKTRVVDGIAYDKAMNIEVDVPANLKGTYKSAVDAIGAVYQRLNAINNGKLVATSFKEILGSINANNKNLSQQIDATALIMHRVLSGSKAAVDVCLGEFSGEFAVKVPFSKVFLSTKEWVDARKDLISMENRLQDVRRMGETITDIEGTLKAIVSSINDNASEVSGKDLKNMSEIVKGIALVFDSYGMATTRQMQLEHNYILCLNRLYDNAR